MHFDILGFGRRFKCGVELVKADVIDVKRKPTKVFQFVDPENFVDIIIGHTSCVVYVGKDSGDAEKWKAYYWEPGYEEGRKGYGYDSGGNILPYGSLAVLEMEKEDDLEWELKSRAEETKRWIALFDQVRSLAKKIRDVDEESEYAESDRFVHMSADELENVLEKMRAHYQGQTKTARVEV